MSSNTFVGSAMPLARATAIPSRAAAWQSATRSESSRIAPAANLVTAVTPLNADSQTNFVQISISIRSLSLPSKPASWHAASRRSRRRPRAVQFAEHQPLVGGVTNDSRLGHHGGDVGRAARRVRATNGLRQLFDMTDTRPSY